MKKYHVTYREEFWSTVEAKDEDDAIKKAKNQHTGLC